MEWKGRNVKKFKNVKYKEYKSTSGNQEQGNTIAKKAAKR